MIWLEFGLNLPQYKGVFQNLSLDGEMIEAITEDDLMNDLEITTRLHRVKIMNHIQKIKQRD